MSASKARMAAEIRQLQAERDQACHLLLDPEQKMRIRLTAAGRAIAQAADHS